MEHQQQLFVRLLIIVSVLFLAEQTNAKSMKQKLRQFESSVDESPGPSQDCGEDQFRCVQQQRCILAEYLCDGDNDCGDMSDEDYDTCRGHECGPRYLRCNNGQCIHKGLFCALQSPGCSDGSLTPTGSCGPVQCPEGMEACPSGLKCIFPNWKCDGDNDCDDMSDESLEICSPIECLTNVEFSCATVRRCIPQRFLCDGDDDCHDNSDEDPANCELNCGDDQFQCRAPVRCVPASYVCDGDYDCGDMSDEDPNLCQAANCGDHDLQCDNGQCVNRERFCSLRAQCRDGSLNPLEECDPSSPEMELLQCLEAVRRPCLEDVFSQYSFNSNEMWQAARESDLITSCRRFTRELECGWPMIHSMGCDLTRLPPSTMQAVHIYNTSIDFICRHHLEVFNEHIDCLLRGSSVDSPVPLLAETISNQCRPMLPVASPFCSSETHECASDLVAEQCGAEIAGYVSNLIAAIRNTIDCRMFL